MSYIGSQVKMLYGGPGDDLARASAGSNHQLIQEQLVTTVGRASKGPQDGQGHWSFHVIVGAGSSPVGTLTVWYSNLPNPDPNIDAHWVLSGAETGAAIDLSVVANTYRFVDSTADNIRFKVTRTSGTISMLLWYKANGA